MNAEKLYISTIAADAPELARRHGLGLEIAEYCTACNMDEGFAENDAAVREKLAGVARRTLHAPFSELFPCAVDPRARELARERYAQAMALAVGYGARKLIIHGGFNPYLYFPEWYTAQSAPFWREFMGDVPQGLEICLENVTEPAPELLCEIIAAVDDPRLKMCLDVGHANAYSKISPMEWLERCAPFIGHFHIHNNQGDWDTHAALDKGGIPMAELLAAAERLCPEATLALEVMEARSSVDWLESIGAI